MESPCDWCDTGPITALFPLDPASGSLTPGPGVNVFSSVMQGPASSWYRDQTQVLSTLEGSQLVPLASILPLTLQSSST